MAGLLDAFNDPEFQRGLLMMAASRPMSEQARAGLLSYVDNQEEAKMKRQYMGLQMEGQRAEIAGTQAKTKAAEAAAENRAKAMGLLGSWTSGQPNASSADLARLDMESGAGFSGPISPQALQTSQAPRKTLADMPFETALQIEMLGGPKDLREYIKDSRQGTKFDPGALYKMGDGSTFMAPKLGEGMIFNGREVTEAPGAFRTAADQAFALKSAEGWAGVNPQTQLHQNKAGIDAGHKLVQRYNPETQRMEFVTEADVIKAAGGTPPTAPRAMPPAAGNYSTEAGLRGNMQGGMGANPQDIDKELAAIRRDLQNPTLDAGSRQLLQQQAQALMAQRGRLPSAGAMAAGPSAIQAAEQEANRVRATETAKADVTRDTGRQTEQKLSGRLTSVMDEAVGILKQGPTASLVGAGVDAVSNAFGRSSKGAELAQRLETLSGWAGSNVPRMEGPQSDRDVITYMTMAGRVGDRSVPIPQRIAAAEQVKSLMKKYSHLNGGEATPQAPTAPAQVSSSPPPRAMKGMVVDGYKFKGGNPADQSNWERQ